MAPRTHDADADAGNPAEDDDEDLPLADEDLPRVVPTEDDRRWLRRVMPGVYRALAQIERREAARARRNAARRRARAAQQQPPPSSAS